MQNMIKWVIIGPILLFSAGCSWLRAHPAAEAELIELGKDAAEEAVQYLEKR